MSSNPIKYSELVIDDGAFKRLITGLEDVVTTHNAAYNTMIAKTKEYANSNTNANAANQGGQRTIRRSATEIEKYNALLEKNKQATSEIGREIKKLTELRKLQNLQLSNEAKLVNAAPGSYNALSAQYALNKLRLNAMSETQRKATAEGQKLEAQTRRLYERMNELQKATGKYTLQVGNYSLAGIQANRTMQRLIEQSKRLEAQGKGNTRQFQEVTRAIQKQSAEMDRIAQKQARVAQVYKGTLGALKSMVGMYLGVMGLIRLFRNVSSVLLGFESSMSRVQAITGASRVEFEKLTQSALHLGATTARTSREVAELQVAYGMLGFKTDEILDATEATILLSQATGEGLAESAAIAGATTRAFMMDAKETGYVVDVMAKSFTSSALNLERWRESMKHAGPTAKAAGVSVAETAALLSVLADAGVHGSIAGTGLKRIFSELTRDGRPFKEALAELAEKGLDLADAQDEVGERAKVALLVINDNIDRIDGLTKSYIESEGEAQKMSDIIMDNLRGSLIILKSAWEGVILTMRNSTGGIRNAVDSLRDALVWIKENSEQVGRFVKVLGYLAAAYVTLKIAVWTYHLLEKARIPVMAKMLKAGYAQNGVNGMLTASTRILTLATKRLKVAMATTGVGLLVAFLSTVAARLIFFKDKLEETTSYQDEYAKSTNKATNEIQAFAIALNKAAPGSKERTELIRQANMQYREYLPSLITEKDSTIKIYEALQQVNIEMRKNIALKASSAEKERLLAEQGERFAKVAGDVRKAVSQDMGSGMAGSAVVALEELIAKLESIGKGAKVVPELTDEFRMLGDEVDGVFKDINIPPEPKINASLFLTNKQAAYNEWLEEKKKYEEKFVVPISIEFDKAMDAYNLSWANLTDKQQTAFIDAVRGFKDMKAGIADVDGFFKGMISKLDEIGSKGGKLAEGEGGFDEWYEKQRALWAKMQEGRAKDLRDQELKFAKDKNDWGKLGLDRSSLLEWNRREMGKINADWDKKDADTSIKTMEESRARDLADLEATFKQLEAEYEYMGKSADEKLALQDWYKREQAKTIQEWDDKIWKQEMDAEKDRISLMEDGYQKTQELLDLEYKDLLRTTKDKAALDNWYQTESYNNLVDHHQKMYDEKLKYFDKEQELEAIRFETGRRTQLERDKFYLNQEKKRLLASLQYAKDNPEALSAKDIEILQARLAQVDYLLANLPKSMDIWEALGIKLKDEEKQAIADSVKYAMGQVAEMVQARMQAAQQALTEAQTQVQQAQDFYTQQIELQKEGLANKRETAEQDLAEQQRRERIALKQAEKAQKAQDRVNTMEQTSNLITAVSKIWKALAAFPWLATAATATMFASFAAAKITAKKYTKQQYRYGGYEEIKGGRHGSGKDVSVGVSGNKELVAEGGEGMIIVRRERVPKYRKELPQVAKALNEGVFFDMYERRDGKKDRIAPKWYYDPKWDLQPRTSDVFKSLTKDMPGVTLSPTHKLTSKFTDRQVFNNTFKSEKTIEINDSPVNLRTVEHLLRQMVKGSGQDKTYVLPDGRIVKESKGSKTITNA